MFRSTNRIQPSGITFHYKGGEGQLASTTFNSKECTQNAPALFLCYSYVCSHDHGFCSLLKKYIFSRLAEERVSNCLDLAILKTNKLTVPLTISYFFHYLVYLKICCPKKPQQRIINAYWLGTQIQRWGLLVDVML